MSGFGSLSDTDEELSAAVDELISQTKDLCALEQVAKINCSGFTDSDLPLELETRFRKLKSFPVSKPRNPVDFKSKAGQGGNFMVDEQKLDGKLCLNEESIVESGKGDGLGKENEHSGSVSSPSWADQAASFPSTNRKKPKEELEAESRAEGSPPGSENLFMDSPSPPRRGGCFWCSPKKAVKGTSTGSRSFHMGKKGDDILLPELGSFSMKEQEKILRKMRKEEEKISKEAEKIVKWAKQASARMSFHGIDDELSDDDEGK